MALSLSAGGVQVQAQSSAQTIIQQALVNPASCPQGKPFKVTFRFDARPSDRDCILFVHVLNKDGAITMQGDSDAIRTSQWSGPFQYTEMLVVPDNLPDGVYKIEAGLYYRTTEKPGYKNIALIAGNGVAASPDNMHFDVGAIRVDHSAPAPPYDSEKPKTLDLTGYKMTFNEDFSEPVLDISRQGPGTRWIAHTPYWGDFGDAAFADPGPDSPFSIKNGVLSIEAKKRPDGHWQSGLISSVDTHGNGFSQLYGYFEMRAKLPKGLGTWPAFWMTDVTNLQEPNPKVTNIEIDVVEQYGISDYLMHTTLHWWHPDGHHEATWQMEYVPNMTDDFHNYGLLWTKQYLVWYFDGVELYRVPTPAELQTHKEYIMVNLALGSGWPIDQTPNPSDMQVKYIRAYAKPQR